MSVLVRWSVTVGLLGLVATLVDLNELFASLRSVHPGWFVAVVLINVGDRLLMVGKWLPLLWVQAPGISPYRALKASFASNFAGFFLPASVGGDVLRSVGLGRGAGAVVEVGASVAVERILGLFGSGVAALLALYVALGEGVPTAFLFPWVLAASGVGLVAAVLPFSEGVQRGLSKALGPFEGRRWAGLAIRFATACHAYRDYRRTVFFVGLLSALEQLIPVLSFAAGAAAIGVDVSGKALLVAVPLMVFASRLPISIAGFGVVEGSMVYLLGLFGVPPLDALSLTLVVRVAEVLVFMPGAIWWKELIGESSDSSS